MQKIPELLAPVGSWDALVAAVQNGADAVYVGGKMFNARKYANNFSEEEMVKAVDYAHIRGTKLYVTVNTLVADHEFPELLTYLKFLNEIGVDAIIVQDMGVARLVNKVFPELEVHASTQMTLHNSAGVETAKKLGIKRVVLAREMALEEIKRIKRETGVEIEFFVHGALCISYSGQCLMSSMIGGRSGNRGQCAQPCRLPYTLINEQGKVVADPDNVGKYLLSPRDLRFLHYIPELTEAGVDSLKIEGRMKRPEYVATVTRIYREALDRYATEPQNFGVLPEEEKQLAQIFNRDFSTGYLFGKPGANLMSYKRPNNRGIKIGRVAFYDWKKGLMNIQLEDNISVGDGIEVWVSQGGRKGIVVNQLFLNGKMVESVESGQEVSIPIEGKIRTGDRVFKTSDAELMRKAGLSFTSPRELRKEDIFVEVIGKKGQPLEIVIKDANGYSGQAKTNFIAEEAIKRPLTRETIEKQMDRMGNTPFNLAQLKVNIEDNIMVPLSELNETRRKALESLEEKRIRRGKGIDSAVIERRWENIQGENAKEPNKQKELLLSTAVGEPKSVEAALKNGADIVYVGAEGLRPKVLQVEELEGLALLAEDHKAELVLSTPRIAKDGDMDYLQPYLNKARDLNLGVLVSELGMLEKVLAMEFTKVYADYSLNIFNSQSLLWLQEKGVKRACISTELTLKQIRNIINPFPLEVVVQGALPLMVSEHCVTSSILGGLSSKNKCNRPCRTGNFLLKDRMGMNFPLVSDSLCRTNIFNPKEINLVEDIKPLYEAGVRLIRMEVRKDDVEYVSQVTKIYRQEVDRLLRNIDSYIPEVGVKDALSELSLQGVTKGHLYRGVI